MQQKYGLHVENGRLLLGGKPFHGIGINYVDAFMRQLDSPGDPTTEKAFEYLVEHAIPFIRTVASGWGGPGMKLYQSDRTEYFRRMDLTVALAEKHHIGIICSMFFPRWPKDLSGERNLDAWADPTSKTHALMATYIDEVITRYRGSPAIWGWEWGNELVLDCHLPNAAVLKILPEDHYSYAAMHKVYAEFARKVRQFDSYRIVESGDTIPRPSGWHQKQNNNWDKDTPEQLTELLMESSTDRLDLLSIHAYGDEMKQDRLPIAAAAARKLRMPLFVGEFGVPGPSTPASKREFKQQLAMLEDQKVVLAALWEFDVQPTPRPEWLISPANDRNYMLLAIEKVNRRSN